MSKEEQTIALKEILGIQTEKVAPAGDLSSATKKKSKKKVDANSKEKKNSGHSSVLKSKRKVHGTNVTHTVSTAAAANIPTNQNNKSQNSSTCTPNNNSSSRNHPGVAGFPKSASGGKKIKKRNDPYRQGSEDKIKEARIQKQQKENKNYAWSAFQSPPDASNLPLPAFGSLSFDHHETLIPTTGDADQPECPTEQSHVISATNAAMTSPNHVNRRLSSTDEIKKILNIPSEVVSKDRESKPMREQTDDGAAGVVPVEEIQNPNTRMTSMEDESKQEPRDEKLLNENDVTNGINLAALALKTDDTAVSWNQHEHHVTSKEGPLPHDKQIATSTPCKDDTDSTDDPLAMLMNPSYGNNRNSANSQNLPTGTSIYSSPFLDPTVNLSMESFGMMSPNNPYIGHYPMVPHPQPFITIQVQVPSQLLPGRRMMVPAAPGCNIPVIVPEGVQGGMVIPVTIPNVYIQNPMPMVPPMSPGQPLPNARLFQQQQQLYPYNHGMEQSFQSESYNSPMAKGRESDVAPGGSWASRVAVNSHAPKK